MDEGEERRAASSGVVLPCSSPLFRIDNGDLRTRASSWAVTFHKVAKRKTPLSRRPPPKPRLTCPSSRPFHTAARPTGEELVQGANVVLQRALGAWLASL